MNSVRKHDNGTAEAYFILLGDDMANWYKREKTLKSADVEEGNCEA
jgi:hypothetical protein